MKSEPVPQGLTMPERIKYAHSKTTDDLLNEAMAALTVVSIRARDLGLTDSWYKANRAISACYELFAAKDVDVLLSGEQA